MREGPCRLFTAEAGRRTSARVLSLFSRSVCLDDADASGPLSSTQAHSSAPDPVATKAGQAWSLIFMGTEQGRL